MSTLNKIETLDQFWAAAELLDPEGFARSRAFKAAFDAVQADAERYRKLRSMVRGERKAGAGYKQAFVFPLRFELPPLSGADIMRGSVSEHLD